MASSKVVESGPSNDGAFLRFPIQLDPKKGAGVVDRRNARTEWGGFRRGIRSDQGLVLEEAPGKRQELSKNWKIWRCVQHAAELGGRSLRAFRRTWSQDQDPSGRQV